MSGKELRGELKRIFTGYSRLTPKIERSLTDLGITVNRKRNHVVLSVACGNEMRMVSLSSTGSDKREGLNIVSKIMNTMGPVNCSV